MTEAEWLAETDPTRLVQFVEGGLSPRRTRLLAAALCRVVDRHGDAPELARALDEVEWFADGLAGAPELDRAYRQCRVMAVQRLSQSDRLALEGGPEDSLPALEQHELAWAVAYAAAVSVTLRDVLMHLSGALSRSRDGEFAVACRGRVLDVAGNPFRPVAFLPEWRTETVLALARQVYDSRDFGAMPILADALQDAGCDSDEVLNHCRDAAITHVRGCWVLDGVAGKE